MLNPIYNKHGQVECWLEEDGVIYDLGGTPILYLKGEHIYTFSGAHKGRFSNGLFRDHGGSVIGFTNGATGGPMKPMKSMKPMKPMKGMKPMKSIPEIPPIKPINQLTWSSLSFNELF